ncbi:tRNA (adenosine(37)-N6)-threonylcarbamoyltransferase complex ATPase subunit type 1 TsaE [Pacificimonas sp. WHA3]|uniref:tRNA (Adenosine(37)-N6)-threonylcarbamoyltransferase complex ATPase subunit type 1 TsaE n=1 Tax=Pacificimonas pallii TaxID=2827236 RepID=A0ABS6SAX3_9SPHN|nr:tRNA (adenosine(37)-N6)-threonylcarbamoyltransferase complex ATPase subunit type 1 TsaE [Pacificimonas pallii]MBV7255490.1 tRNA (adenosine(37)-N6)-threonylcarbamoyltransferase complex ATPase subunit type 1 TsaE [Pacificimonas pallii]
MQFADEGAQQAFGVRLGACLQAGDIVALSGPLGAGKTVLARGMLRGAGHAGEVPSPTFTLVQPYEGPGMRLPVWHSDLYRLGDAEEILPLALDDVLEDGALIVEWPERGGTLLPGPALKLTLDGTGDAVRILTAQVPESWERRWARL